MASGRSRRREGGVARRALFVASVLLGFRSAGAGTQGPSEAGSADWRLSGETVFRAEDYESHGDPAAAIYPFTGLESFGLINLSFEGRLSPYHSWRSQILLL